MAFSGSPVDDRHHRVAAAAIRPGEADPHAARSAARWLEPLGDFGYLDLDGYLYLNDSEPT